MNSNGPGRQKSFTNIAIEHRAGAVGRECLLAKFQCSLGSRSRSYLFTSARGRIGDNTAPKYGTKPIRYVTLHFRDWRGTASPRYRNRAATTVRVCGQKPYTVWQFRRRAKDIQYSQPRPQGAFPSPPKPGTSALGARLQYTQYHLRNIAKIRRYLSEESSQILVHAFISSKLDNCNSLLYGLPKHLLNRLRLIQNTAARIVTLSKRFDHITPILFKLHWLPLGYRIHFKILLLVYKCLNGLAPSYIPRTQLKTYLFKLAYDVDFSCFI